MTKHDHITGKSSEPERQNASLSSSQQASDYVRKTYLLTSDLIARVEALAEAEHVGLNELVRWLLNDALTRVEMGETELPTKPVQRRTLES